MGINYYLIRKIKYNKEENTPFSLGCDPSYCAPKHIKNGWVVKNTYYKTCEEFEENYEQLIHIGKSSFGWHFLLAIYPEYGIHNFEDWKKLFFDPNNSIRDESDQPVTPEQMLKIITQRRGRQWREGMTREDAKKEEEDCIERLRQSLPGDDYDEYLGRSHAERGNYFLFKHSSKYNKDVVETEDPGATYDYIVSGNDPEKGAIFS